MAVLPPNLPIFNSKLVYSQKQFLHSQLEGAKLHLTPLVHTFNIQELNVYNFYIFFILDKKRRRPAEYQPTSFVEKWERLTEKYWLVGWLTDL